MADLTTPGAATTLLRTTVAFACALFALVGVVVYLLWTRPTEPIVLFVPVYILVWGLLGGGVGVLHRLAFHRGDGKLGPELFTWVVAKPIIGMVMGGIVYFLAVSGELFLNGRTQITNIHFLNVLAFIAGFSDRFSIDVIDRVAAKAGQARGARGARARRPGRGARAAPPCSRSTSTPRRCGSRATPRRRTSPASCPRAATARGWACRACSRCSPPRACARPSTSPAGWSSTTRPRRARSATPATRSATTAGATTGRGPRSEERRVG